MTRKIRMYSFETIFKDIEHLQLEEDHQALLAMMIKFANDTSQSENWSWLNFATILYGARKNAGNRRWFYNTKDGTRLKKEQLMPYYLQLEQWQKKGWITLVNAKYDGTLSRNASWNPLPAPNRGDTTIKYIINLKAIEEFGVIPTTKLF